MYRIREDFLDVIRHPSFKRDCITGSQSETVLAKSARLREAAKMSLPHIGVEPMTLALLAPRSNQLS